MVVCSVCLSLESLLNTVKDTTIGNEYYRFLMAALGKIDEFDNCKEDWREYEEHLTHFFFLANCTEAAEKKRAVLLSVIAHFNLR